MYDDLIKEFKSIRRRLGFSQENIGENAEVSMYTVNRMEKGTSIPRLDKFIEMCRGMGYMVVITPIPKSIKPVEIVTEVIVEVEKKTVDYDNWNETKPEEEEL